MFLMFLLIAEYFKFDKILEHHDYKQFKTVKLTNISMLI